MEKLPITSQHLVIAQRIVDFVQQQGWDVDGIHIQRYDDNDHPLIGKTEGDEWKGAKIKWSLRLEVAPRDDDTIKVPAKERAP